MVNIIKSIFGKMIGEKIVSSKTYSIVLFWILLFIALVVGIIALEIWFFCACYGWFVLVHPPLAAFPRWAFVLLMFMLLNRGGGSNSKSSS